MDNVFVKVKKLRKQPIFKLVSDSSIYDSIILNDVDCVDYDPDHNLDEDSWFKIENFSNETFCLDLLKENFDVKDYDDLDKSRFVDITYIFSNQDNVFYFQKVTPSLFLKRKTIVFGESAEIENSKTRLVINSLPCSGTVKLATNLEVIYDITSDKKVNNEKANKAHIQCRI